ncbi:helix-turn-helix transcriptional regulator [Neobacillus massiliamazoniensis]|uniref:Helix-turn-helix domain-containing protein n=1 Tax=Neobacillus massiliamazoniensis TaxID=1499688 RepID=A0A0U1NVN9_9BACI|nr:helix-turn-helix transcriptional regulator [Neobacillus massiliamazoniensis]CRK82101.1 helix-turn-helix domain-containing protein [Neobacillus massiliamazoniensis]
MQDIVYKTFSPVPALRPYVKTIFVLETKSGLSKTDFSITVPNSSMKLVIPFKNNMRSIIGNCIREHKESTWFILGLSTHATVVECDADYGNICVEFKPLGAYRFFNVALNELKNQIYTAEDIFNKEGEKLQEKLKEMISIDEKVRFVQQFLCRQMLLLNKSDPITEYAVNQITKSKGLITVSELSEKMGYSRRYLATKFSENVGLSPKELTSVIKFQEAYRKMNLMSLEDNELYEMYYDQSHFIKEFKKFTGLPPKEYIMKNNKLGTIFYKE